MSQVPKNLLLVSKHASGTLQSAPEFQEAVREVTRELAHQAALARFRIVGRALARAARRVGRREAQSLEPRPAAWGRSAPQLCRDTPLARAFSVGTAPCPRIRLHSQTAKAPGAFPVTSVFCIVHQLKLQVKSDTTAILYDVLRV